MKSKTITRDSLLTSYEVGELLQVDPSTVNKWVKEGRITAFKTPGGHHRIRAADLLGFLEQHKMPVPPSLTSVAHRRLLVVDDDPQELRAMARMFRPLAHVVELKLIDKPIDALVQVGAFAPQVVLLDVVMPGLDGIEVCRRLKAMDETRSIKVLVASAHMTADVEAQALAAGAVQCFAKPVALQALLAVLGVPAQAGGEATEAVPSPQEV